MNGAPSGRGRGREVEGVGWGTRHVRLLVINPRRHIEEQIQNGRCEIMSLSKRIKLIIAIVTVALLVAFLGKTWHYAHRANRCYSRIEVGATRQSMNEALISEDIWCESTLPDPRDYTVPTSCEFTDGLFTYIVFVDPRSERVTRKTKTWDPRMIRRSTFDSFRSN